MKPTRYSLLVLDAAIFVATVAAVVEPWNDEQRLVSDLWAAGAYDAGTRPVRNVSQPVLVTLVPDVFAVLRLDSKNQEFAVATTFSARWQDDRLRWNPTNYSGLTAVSVPAKTVWYPRIMILNAFDETWLVSDDTDLVVSSEGKLYFGLSLIHITQCYLDETRFPFDNQTCNIIIGTRNVPHEVVAIEGTEVKTPRERVKAVDNWDLDGIIVTNRVSPSCITEQITAGKPCLRTSQVLLNVRLAREPSYYLYTVFGPCTILVIIASAIFWLPPECGEKLSFGIAILFGFVIFQLVIYDALVEAGSGPPPLLVRYVLWSFLLVGVAMLGTVLTISMHHWSDTHDPESKSSVGLTENQNCIHRTAVYDLPPTPTRVDSEDQAARTEHQPNIRRNWRKIAKYVDRIFFVLYYIAYIIFSVTIVSEKNSSG